MRNGVQRAALYMCTRSLPHLRIPVSDLVLCTRRSARSSMCNSAAFNTRTRSEATPQNAVKAHHSSKSLKERRCLTLQLSSTISRVCLRAPQMPDVRCWDPGPTASPAGHPGGLVPFIKQMGTVARMHSYSVLHLLLKLNTMPSLRDPHPQRDGEFAKLVNETTGLHLMHYAERLDTVSYDELNRAIRMCGGQYMASPIMRGGTVSHHIFIDVDRQVVHDPAHPSAEVGSGIPVDSRGWTKQLGDWETWHVCDVQEVVANDSLHDMVACYVCNSAFQPAKEVRYCRNNQARHENGKCHKASIQALQIK